MTILVRCSGWSYDDWVGKFYPMELAKRKGDWFSYYAQFFSTVEINSTFYRPPGELQVQSWVNKAKDLKGIEYSVKVPQLVTHKRSWREIQRGPSSGLPLSRRLREALGRCKSFGRLAATALSLLLE